MTTCDGIWAEGRKHAKDKNCLGGRKVKVTHIKEIEMVKQKDWDVHRELSSMPGNSKGNTIPGLKAAAFKPDQPRKMAANKC